MHQLTVYFSYECHFFLGSKGSATLSTYGYAAILLQTHPCKNVRATESLWCILFALMACILPLENLHLKFWKHSLDLILTHIDFFFLKLFSFFQRTPRKHYICLAKLRWNKKRSASVTWIVPFVSAKNSTFFRPQRVDCSPLGLYSWGSDFTLCRPETSCLYDPPRGPQKFNLFHRLTRASSTELRL